MKWLAIANPAAGRAHSAEAALQRLRVAGPRHEVARKVAPGDATRLARQAGDFDGLIAVGYVAGVVTLGRQRLPALGRVAYAAAAMLVVPERFSARMGNAHGRGDTRQLTGVVINNTAHLANFRDLPDASTNDGLLDIMEQDCGWSRQLLHDFAVLSGSRAFGPLRLRQSAAEQIEMELPRTLMANGELLHEVTRLSVRCLPAAVCCVVGPQ